MRTICYLVCILLQPEMQILIDGVINPGRCDDFAHVRLLYIEEILIYFSPVQLSFYLIVNCIQISISLIFIFINHMIEQINRVIQSEISSPKSILRKIRRY